MAIEEAIVLKRPDIKQSSLKTYLVSLKCLRKNIDGKTELENTNFLQDYDLVMDSIKDMKITTKKNRITSILVALGSDLELNTKLIDKYQNKLKELNDQYSAFLKTQKKTDTQEKNWLEYNDLVEVYNNVMKDIKHNKITTKKQLNNADFDLLQQLVILRTYLDFPLRNDFADMKIIDHKEYKKLDDNDDQNYLAILPKNKKQFILNDFKNKKKIGRKRLDVTQSLNKLINLWLKHNTSGYYLVKTDRKTPMNPNNITKYLNKLFMKKTGKKIGSSLIRHIVISKITENEPTIEEEEEKEKAIENKFLHSKEMNKLYRKID